MLFTRWSEPKEAKGKRAQVKSQKERRGKNKRCSISTGGQHEHHTITQTRSTVVI